MMVAGGRCVPIIDANSRTITSALIKKEKQFDSLNSQKPPTWEPKSHRPIVRIRRSLAKVCCVGKFILRPVGFPSIQNVDETGIHCRSEL